MINTSQDWKVYATPVEFLEVCGRVETSIALKYGLKRGWFSYTDLTQFLLASNYPTLLSGIAESVVKVCILFHHHVCGGTKSFVNNFRWNK